MVYPLLAAKHAQLVDRVYVTTDAPAIARVARHHGVEVMDRSQELSAPSTTLEDLLRDAFARMKAQGQEPEMVVLLLCNAPTVTSGMIDHGIELLRRSPTADAVVSVSPHNEFGPWLAQRMGDDGSLRPLVEEPAAPRGGDAYFIDALLWVLRPQAIWGDATKTILSDNVVNTATQRVLPLPHEGYGDVDYRWQIPIVEEWLRRQGFSEESTPYDDNRSIPALAATRADRAATDARLQQASRRVLVTTIPFGEVNRRSIEILDENGVDYTINPIGRKLKDSEVADMIGDYGLLIAGTERISAETMDRAPHLRLIARVGIGLDNVDLSAARQRNILVSYTPDGPSPAVAELTIGLMLSLLRSIPNADRGLRSGIWHRFMGRRLEKLTVGVLGVGRIGRRVIRHLSGFGPRILANDLKPDLDFGIEYNVEWVDKEVIYREADIITLHLPRTPLTQNLITQREMALMKPGAMLINTSRGDMIDESDLASALRAKRIGGAAIDVFGQEPYSGELCLLENCLLSCHMGSMSQDCRFRMELEAAEEVVRFLRNEPLKLLVPDSEYAMHEAGLKH